MDIILMQLKQETYCLEKCTHANHRFSYLWTNSDYLSFYSHILRQGAEKVALILILQSQSYRQQDFSWWDAQSWQSQKDFDQVALEFYAWDFPS